MNRLSGNPVAGFAGQVLVHPSHICQIGESNQWLIAVFSYFLSIFGLIFVQSVT